MKIQSSDIFTTRVNALMKKLSLSKKDMAERLNVDYSTFWRKLNGKRNIDIAVLMQIAEILGTTASYLVGETDNPCEVEKVVQNGGSCIPDGKGNIVCSWGKVNKITLPDNDKARQVLYDFFMTLSMEGLISNEDIPSDILQVIPLEPLGGFSDEEKAYIITKAINKAVPDKTFRVVFADKYARDDKAVNNDENVPVVSAYNGNNSSYTGNSLTVEATA